MSTTDPPRSRGTAAPAALCHGLVATDFLVRARFPVPRDVKVRVPGVVRQGGGPAANAAVALARLGARAAFAGAVGDDALGREQVSELAREGVDVSRVETAAGTASFVSLILVDAVDGARTIFSAPAGRPLATDRALPDPAPDLVLVDAWGGDAQRELARSARARGIPVLLDAGSWRGEVAALLPHCDVVIGSAPFARAWAGSVEAAVTALLENGARLAAITRGALGAVAAEAGGGRPFVVEAVPVDPVDTTGAGDAFHGGAAFGLISGLSWAESLRLASRVAALKCRAPGARAGLPRAEELA